MCREPSLAAHTPESQDPAQHFWLVVTDYESGEEVDRRGPFDAQEAAQEARSALRETWTGKRYLIRIRTEWRES